MEMILNPTEQFFLSGKTDSPDLCCPGLPTAA